MDNVDLNVLRQATTWLAQGHRVVLGTITRTWGSAPRPSMAPRPHCKPRRPALSAAVRARKTW